MSAVRSLAPLATLLCLSSLAQAQTAPRIVPEHPVQFERVSLRQTVDSCVFDESRVNVAFEGNTIVVTAGQNACLVAGPPEVVDIQLGAFPVGTYRLELRHADNQPPVERLEFTVEGLAVPAVFPPFPLPIANYTGLWLDGDEAGWGLSLHQGHANTLFGALFVYGNSGDPEWYTLQSGQWESSTRWRGTVVHSNGPSWLGASTFDTTQVQHANVGDVVLDFTMDPGEEDQASFTLTVGGTTVSKTISRPRL